MSSNFKTELERKKARLAALKEDKARRERLKADGNENVPPSYPDSLEIRQEAEQILKSLNLNEEVKQIGFVEPLTNGESSVTKLKKKKLGISQQSHTSIPPKSTVSYDKEAQTVEIRDYINSGTFQDHDWIYDDTAVYDDDDFASSRTLNLPTVSLIEPELTEKEELALKMSRKKSQYSVEEIKSIESSDSFLIFLNKATNKIIKSLQAPDIVYKDYTGAELDEDRDSMQKPMLTSGPIFFDETWSVNRNISCLNWSPIHNELIAVSYQENAQALHEPPGIVLIWNTKVERALPEFVLHSQSPVTKVIFAPFHANLIIGGTIDGIVNIWDIRVHRRLPVMRTNLSSPHTQPIRALQAGGSLNAPTLQSLSSDGILATWSLDMLNEPNEHVDLNIYPMKTISPMCMSAINDTESRNSNHTAKKFIIGSESGDALLADVSSSNQSNNSTPASRIKSTFSGHTGPISAISSHPFVTPPAGLYDHDFSNLFITASDDFTVRLWSLDNVARPLHTFNECFEPVTDCDWSPSHPATFTCVDLSSELFLWNINVDPEIPICRVRCDRRNAFFSRCLFNPTGHWIACGDSSGRLELFALNEQRMAPKPEDWTNFKMWVSECSSRQMGEET